MVRQPVPGCFETHLRDRVVRPGDPRYEELRRVWNGMVDRHPAVIVRCRDVTDVVTAVRLSYRERLPVTVRAGGHSVAGTSVRDDGVVIDVGALTTVQVDPNTRTAVVGAGARWCDVDSATQAFNLATTGGVDSRTGAIGLTLGGGVGYLARRCGLAADNLVAAQVVLADGHVVRASESENQDLLWGLRGGGGGLGVVTSMKLRLHALGPDIPTFQSFYTLDNAAEALQCYRELIASAPDELTCYALIVRIPPLSTFPERVRGEPALVLSGCWTGPQGDRGVDMLQSIARMGTAFAASVQSMPYVALQSGSDAATPAGARYYWKSLFLHDLSDGLIGALVDYGRSLPGEYSTIGLEPLGGAVARVAPEATAFPHRHATFGLGIWSGWAAPDDDDRVVAGTRALHSALLPETTGGMYANYLDHDDLDRPEAAYGRNVGRLRELKQRYMR